VTFAVNAMKKSNLLDNYECNIQISYTGGEVSILRGYSIGHPKQKMYKLRTVSKILHCSSDKVGKHYPVSDDVGFNPSTQRH
jgi:hypothetical protein